MPRRIREACSARLPLAGPKLSATGLAERIQSSLGPTRQTAYHPSPRTHSMQPSVRSSRLMFIENWSEWSLLFEHRGHWELNRKSTSGLRDARQHAPPAKTRLKVTHFLT